MSEGIGFYYTIVKGDTLSRIALAHGLRSWQIIWDHPKNESFRNARSSPNNIFPGEIVWIPAEKMAPRGQSGKTNSYTISPIGVKSLAFSNDYDGLLRNDSDWTSSGTPINEPKWDQTHSDPIAFPIKTIPELEVTFHVEMIPSIKGEFFGDADALFLTYRGKGDFYKGDVTYKTKAQGAIWDVIKKYSEDIKIEWKITTKQGTINAGVTRHIIYGIFGDPINEGLPEDGATTKRMDTAMQWVIQTLRREPDEIVEKLFGFFQGYTLNFNMLPKELRDELDADPVKKQKLTNAGFASYLKEDIGGAWPLAEFKKYGGECQAIVRLIRGMLHQIGCPGIIEVMYVNAVAPNHLKPVISSYGTVCLGPDSKKKYALVDGEVHIDGIYGKNDKVGFNNYEAYMKFTFKDKSGVDRVAWIGGGVGKVGSVETSKKDEVRQLENSLIKVFWALVEYEPVSPDGVEVKRKITRIWSYK
jgi:hypothetical protein